MTWTPSCSAPKCSAASSRATTKTRIRKSRVTGMSGLPPAGIAFDLELHERAADHRMEIAQLVEADATGTLSRGLPRRALLGDEERLFRHVDHAGHARAGGELADQIEAGDGRHHRSNLLVCGQTSCFAFRAATAGIATGAGFRSRVV